MKVSELIELLKNCNQDAIVVIPIHDTNDDSFVSPVKTIDSENVYLPIAPWEGHKWETTDEKNQDFLADKEPCVVIECIRDLEMGY